MPYDESRTKEEPKVGFLENASDFWYSDFVPMFFVGPDQRSEKRAAREQRSLNSRRTTMQILSQALFASAFAGSISFLLVTHSPNEPFPTLTRAATSEAVTEQVAERILVSLPAHPTITDMIRSVETCSYALSEIPGFDPMECVAKIDSARAEFASLPLGSSEDIMRLGFAIQEANAQICRIAWLREDATSAQLASHCVNQI